MIIEVVADALKSSLEKWVLSPIHALLPRRGALDFHFVCGALREEVGYAPSLRNILSMQEDYEN